MWPWSIFIKYARWIQNIQWYVWRSQDSWKKWAILYPLLLLRLSYVVPHWRIRRQTGFGLHHEGATVWWERQRQIERENWGYRTGSISAQRRKHWCNWNNWRSLSLGGYIWTWSWGVNRNLPPSSDKGHLASKEWGIRGSGVALKPSLSMSLLSQAFWTQILAFPLNRHMTSGEMPKLHAHFHAFILPIYRMELATSSSWAVMKITLFGI